MIKEVMNSAITDGTAVYIITYLKKRLLHVPFCRPSKTHIQRIKNLLFSELPGSSRLNETLDLMT